MKINYMKEFITLAEKLNYTRSADELFMTQSILSRHIKNIEEEFGIPLFIRSTHGVELTVEGKFVYNEFIKILNQYEAMVDVLSSHAKGLFGNIKIGILYYAIEDYMTKIIAPFKEKYSEIDVSIVSHQPPSLIHDLLNNKIDIALTMKVSLPDCSNLQIFDINSEPMIILFPSSHRLFGKTEVSIKELKDEKFVFIKSENWHEPYIRKLLSIQGLDTIKYIYTQQIDTLANTIIDNNAVTIVAHHISNMNRKNISKVVISEKTFQIVISLAYMSDNNNPSLNVFLNTIKPHNII